MKNALLAGLSFAVLQSGARAQAPERFPDFGFLPKPKDYSGKVFKLSQKYPAVAPGREQLPKFFNTDFQTDWKQYLLQVREYCFEGNIGHSDIGDDFRLEEAFTDVTKPPRWYHMPWQHWGATGREGIHGLTKEAPVGKFALAATQKTEGQTYAVAFYNAAAAATIGEVWKRFIPDAKVTAVPGGGFPEGTVIFKLLFVTNPVEEIPFLGKAENCAQWSAYVTETFIPLTVEAPRKVRKLSLVQMDIMVKDSRAPSKWIFGTYQYNAAVKEEVKWNRLVPLGIMWGNDPDNTETDPHTRADDKAAKEDMRKLTATPINAKLKATRVTGDAELPPTHLGWNGRLNGPVDNPMSSCMSCHQTAQYPFVSVMGPTFLRPKDTIPGQGTAAWMHWFRDLPCGETFDAGSESTDGSLQLAMSMRNFYEWFKTQQGGSVRSAYLEEQRRSQIKKPAAVAAPNVPLEENKAILRDERKD